MDNTWITDVRHFLKDDGTLADMPKQALKLTNYFGRIIKKLSQLVKGIRWLPE
jgi:hypothetical protein